ncbi:HlyD family secretion protein [Paracraurococcus ruber]|uniref:Hemolysin secretion protein D n=1 Tax=Paracraurococcus ruber TaxID=77675 RepID=A0ABS1CV25_9PROT|nr:HlyD family secretion protein [Paracraurococcus ruber]MBK1657812.1 hemolysin secretion protein D [Paracraurococcus ruber]TDG31410.1 HlyD family secretion protein [Paracraurococcus ruber]
MPEGSIRAERAADAATAAAQAPPRRRWLRPALMLGGVLAVGLGAGAFWLQGGRYAGTDDAYVQADKLLLSTDVSGIVERIAVREGQVVRAGEVLVTLDPAPFRFAVQQAEASVLQTRLNLQAMQADYRRIQRDAAAQEAAVQLAQATNDRAAQIVGSGAVTRAAYDQARFGLAQAQQQLESLKVQAQVQLAKLGGQADAPVEQHPDYLAAEARLGEARRQLDHTSIRAPFAGVVTQVSSLQPGQYLGAASPAFALVSSDRIWVDALPKETDLTHVKPGDAATVTVDTYPGTTWRGTVESISPASGSTFSVLPAQNASGNWVKVVQRIPVRIRVEQPQDAPRLRAGMSAVVSIDTGHERHLSDLVGG